MVRPFVIVMILLTIFVGYRSARGAPSVNDLTPDIVFVGFVAVFAVATLITAQALPNDAALFPTISSTLLSLVAIGYFSFRLRSAAAGPNQSPAGDRSGPPKEFLFTLLVGGACPATLAFGHLIAAAVIILGFGAIARADRHPGLLFRALAVTLVVYVLFDLMATSPWPTPWLLGG